MRVLLQILLPIIVVLAALGITKKVIDSRPVPEAEKPIPRHPWVEVETVKFESKTLKIHSQGNVRPRTQSSLVSEISGKVIEISPAFADGGFFEKDQVLLKIEKTDYELAFTRAKSLVEQAEVALIREKAEGEIAKKEWESMGEKDAQPSPLTLRIPQLKEAQARLEAAKADLASAERNLDRTEIKAPYTGRVRMKNVDLGQFIAQGAPLATIYAVDFAEIRLSLTSEDLAYLNLPLNYREDTSEAPTIKVILSAKIGGKDHSWEGKIVRTEGEIDPRTRLFYAVAQVADPYKEDPNQNRPPLSANLFVTAEIEGKTFEKTFSIPRQAIRGSQQDQILIVDDQRRIHFRKIDILKRNLNNVIISGGVNEGEQVITSRMNIVVENMKVRIQGLDQDVESQPKTSENDEDDNNAYNSNSESEGSEE